MSYRYRIAWDWSELEQKFARAGLPIRAGRPQGGADLKPRDVRPRETAPVIRSIDPERPSEGVQIVQLRWDLVPFFHKGALKVKNSLFITARVEGAPRSHAFKEPFQHHRCLVPASAFYEWTGLGDAKEMWIVRHVRQPVFCFAGLWEQADTTDGLVESFTILTTSSGPDLIDMDERQPIIVRPEHWATWLNPAAPIDELIRTEARGSLVLSQVEP